MNRILGWLAAVGLTGLVFVGCGIQPPAPDRDGDDDDCKSGQVCGGVCTNLGFDPNNCGVCGARCAPGLACTNGSCVCAQGFQQCGTSCINVVSDRNNCGNCGIVCPPAAQFCSTGQCSATCNLTTCPSGACADLASDQSNCGACGNVCPGGSVCASGVCSCPAGTVGCGSACVAPGTCNIGTGGTTGTGGTSGVGGTPPNGGGSGLGGTGGLTTGGNAGASTGGTPTGGMSGAGPTGGTGGVTGTPPGWWTHGNWHGCAWTGIDTVAGTTTMNMPRDFTMHQAGTGYCLQGTVHAAYESVSLMGFNLNETPTSNAMQCAYNPANATMMGPPGVTLTGTGLAINFSKSTGATLRVQIQGPNAATNENERWCYTIMPTAGPVFAPFAMFNTKCWEPATGTNYANQPISAVAFLVPGALSPTPFNYCVTGFAAGSSTADAPTWGTGTTGPLMGTIGGQGAMDLDFQRVKVSAGGKSYIIQNNNWGNPNGSDQLLTYRDNSFTVTSSNGTGSQAPASFPSIYIGANGDTQMGTFSTTSDDHLPKQISLITGVQTTFRHTGTNGQLNAAYDIWFAASPPTARYDDAISGFIMLWLYDPNGASTPQPIGQVMRSNVMIENRAWNVWVGPRGGSGPNAGAPVVSYVATNSPSTSFTGNLKPFFTDAAQHGINQAWYLTDVFAGFECWSGANCQGKEVQEFTAVVSP